MSYLSQSMIMSFGDDTRYINAKPSGIRTVMMKKVYGQFDAMLSYHSKVIAIRWDLHQPTYTPTNKRITVFLRRLKKRLEAHYRLSRMGYVWARECSDHKDNQHYHFMVLLDNHKVKHSSTVLNMADKIWIEMGGSFSIPKNPFYKLCRDDYHGISDAIYRASYLAKGATKGNRPIQTKDYSTSLFTTPS